MTTLTDDLGVSLVSQNTIDALEQYASLHVDDFRGLKEDFLTWLSTEGKRPVKGVGYKPNTVLATHYKIDMVYRWLWDKNDLYETTITPEDANEFCNKVMKEQTDEVTADFVKALKRYFAWRSAHTEQDIEWEFENWNELNLNAQKKSIDYFRHQEMSELYQAALEYGSMKSYHSSTMDPEERDRLKILLAQRMEIPKHEVGPDEFKQANSWKFPSLIATTIDVGLRPIEVERSKRDWIDLRNGKVVIPARESTKNEEPWECIITPRTQRALNQWLTEREHYEKYDESESIWLTKYGNPYGTNSLNKLLERLLDRTEIQPNGRDLTWYAIRRGCATMWANKGDVHDAKEQLRHSELKTTMRYVHSSTNRRQGLAETLW